MGGEVAPILKIPFIDLDMEVERSCDQTITSIFENYGEDFFREKEAHALYKINTEIPEFVMATGGGAPCFHSGIEKMNIAGITIFLDVPVETIANRMSNDEKALRPLFSTYTDENILERLKDIRNKRLPFYKKARIILKEDEIEVDRILERIKDLPK